MNAQRIRSRMSGDRRRGSLSTLVRTRAGAGGRGDRVTEFDCFGCIGRSSQVTDVRVNIGESLEWDKPLYQACSIPLRSYLIYGLNCDLYGTGTPNPCGPIVASGTTAVKFHSVGIDAFGGNLTLQRNPSGACSWKKRHVKLLQQVWHDATTRFNPASAGGGIAGTYPSVHEDIVTYPYTDPVDAADQWSPVVYPADQTSPGYHLPVMDARCYTPFGPWPASGPGAGPIWQCDNSSIANTLQLSIVKLGPSGFPCFSPDDLVYDYVSGVPHWELKLTGPQTWAGNTTISTTGEIGMAGVMSGAVSLYGGRLGASATLDVRNPAVDLEACPPYYKIAPDSYCAYGQSFNQLFSAYDPVILRWVKPVDCDTDFNGEPLLLNLALPRAYAEGCSQYSRCSNYHINAEKFGMSGYSETAVVELMHV